MSPNSQTSRTARHPEQPDIPNSQTTTDEQPDIQLDAADYTTWGALFCLAFGVAGQPACLSLLFQLDVWLFMWFGVLQRTNQRKIRDTMFDHELPNISVLLARGGEGGRRSDEGAEAE